MQYFNKLKAAVAVAALCVGVPASASTFNFLGLSGSDTSSLSFNVDGIGLTVTAGTFSSGSNPSSIDFSTRRVDRSVGGQGLGVDSSGDAESIDGFAGNDVLVFTFDQEVTIDRIFFGGVDGNDDFAFGDVTGSSFTRIVNFQDVAGSVFTSSFGGDTAGLGFGIGAIGTADNFSIRGLEVSAVPLPAAGWMLLAGVGGIAAMRRKKKA